MSKADQREEVVFEAALKLSADERAAYLDQTCAGDAELRKRVECLLGAFERAGQFMKQPATPLFPIAGEGRGEGVLRQSSATEKPGDRIGRYKLLEQIGEGGCGMVYVAEQEEPVRRRVALKVIKLGMDTKQVIARFDAERQALALMDHPNIAKVHDAGATETGRPYFVMELVRGVKITQHCEQHQLSTRERLELFIQVCRAIQHAHQKGIIHRDIKPSNILVTVNDGVAVPKVIDFGIAKATQGRLTDQTVYTAFEQFIGTPAYMSPEQAVMTSLDIDTRTDIYSLGVLLYELLTGNTPFDAKELLSKGLDEMRRTIREVEPVKPSTRLTRELATANARRPTGESVSSRRRLQEVRGDLDWIVMKCLDKDRSRRYETANGLATDIQRHLHNDPIFARPPTGLYRLQKTFRRNKAAFVGGVTVALALIVATIASLWGIIEANWARDVAVGEKTRADKQAANAKRLADSMAEMLSFAGPESGKKPDYTVRQMLDDYVAHVGTQFAGQPEVEAALRTTIGEAYWRLGDYGAAGPQLKQSLALRRRAFGEQHEQYADGLVSYSITVPWSVAGFAEGEAAVEQALAIYRARGLAGKPVIHALWALQLLLSFEKKFTELEAVDEQLLAEARKFPGVNFPEVASMDHLLVAAKIRRGDLAGAERVAREGLELDLRLHGAEHFETGWGYMSLGEALEARHNFPAALEAEKQGVSILRAASIPGHESVGQALGKLSHTVDLASQASALMQLFPSREKLIEFESWVCEFLVFARFRPDVPNDPALTAMGFLARFPKLCTELSQELEAAGKPQEAAAALADGPALIARLESQYTNAALLCTLKSVRLKDLLAEGRKDDALVICREISALPLTSGGLLNELAWHFAAPDNPDDLHPAVAVELARRAAELEPDNFEILNTLGVALCRAGEWQQSVTVLERCMRPENKGGTSYDFFALATAYRALGNEEAARRFYAMGTNWMTRNAPGSEPLSRFRDEAAQGLGLPAGASSSARILMSGPEPRALTVQYLAQHGPLASAQAVRIHVGWNLWQGIPDPDPPMRFNSQANCWEVTVPIPSASTQLDCAFSDGQGQWDNNHHRDWHFPLGTNSPSQTR